MMDEVISYQNQTLSMKQSSWKILDIFGGLKHYFKFTLNFFRLE